MGRIAGMGGTSSDSDSGSGLESSANTNSQLESLTGPEFLRRNLWDWSRLLLMSEGLIYPWKETKKQMKQPRINVNEQPARNLASKLTILTSWNCYLLRLKLCADLIEAKGFSFVNLINFEYRQKTFVTLSRFWPLRRWGWGGGGTKIFFLYNV